MPMPALLAAVRRHLFGPPWGPFARGAWCRKQRRHLSTPGHSVVWVHGDVVPWAEWGAAPRLLRGAAYGRAGLPARARRAAGVSRRLGVASSPYRARSPDRGPARLTERSAGVRSDPAVRAGPAWLLAH